MFSFGCIELLSITAAEAKDPARSIRTAARTTIVRLAFFYVLCIGIVVCLVPWQQASGSREDVATSPFVMVFDRIGIPGAAHITNLLVLIAALSAANANLYAGSRILHSLASDGLAPRFAAHLTGRRVPAVGIALSSIGLIGAALLAFSGVGGVFGYMMSLVVFAVIMVWALILATYIAFRRRGESGTSFRMPGGVVTALVGLAGLAAVFATVFVRPSMQVAAMVGIPAVLLASVLYLVVGRRRVDARDIDSAFEEAETMR
jgi:L-asparagine transporter-like permease